MTLFLYYYYIFLKKHYIVYFEVYNFDELSDNLVSIFFMYNFLIYIINNGKKASQPSQTGFFAKKISQLRLIFVTLFVTLLYFCDAFAFFSLKNRHKSVTELIFSVKITLIYKDILIKNCCIVQLFS